MKITESYIRKIIQDELVGLLENVSHSLSPEDKGVLMAVGQALEKAIDTVSKYTNIDNDNESTHEGIIGIQSMLEDAVILQQKLLSGEPHEASDEYDNGESTKVADDDLRLISFALRPDATDEERKAANERLDQIIGQSPLQERKINEAELPPIAQALGRISTFINKSDHNPPIDIKQRNQLNGDLMAVSEEIRTLERKLGARGKDIGYIVPGTSLSNPVVGDPSKRVKTMPEEKGNE